MIKYIVFLLVIIGIYYLFFKGEDSVFRIGEYKKKISELENDTLMLNKKIKEIEYRGFLLKKGDRREIEKNAREKFHYKYEGEKIYNYKIRKGD